MMKSPVKEKMIRILLDGNAHPEIELTRGAGFSRVTAIQKWVRAFENARFIVRRPVDRKEEYHCQLILSRDTARRIYYYPEFRQLRPLIRMTPWFGPLFTDQFTALPGDLHLIINEMIKKSHTFFEIIDTYDTHQKVWEIYHPCLYVNELQGIKNEEFNAWCLYYQLYVQSIVRDLSGGGLGEGFMDLVGDVQSCISKLQRKKAKAGGVHRGA
jgi:hypothetical protein